MTNFQLLSEEEDEKVWKAFYNLFHFEPSIDQFPGIKTERVHLKFDIKDCFSPNYPYDKLEEFALDLFKNISSPGERLYSLDWHHPSYDFDPRKPMERGEFDEWIVPIFPNGDYYIFLTKDFNNVWFGHPWEQTITLIGDEIVEFAQKMQPGFPK